MSISVYVLDTSYLDELFNVPGFSNLISATKVKEKFEMAIESGSRLFVPLPCIFELGDHISRVSGGKRRAKLAKELFHTILSSIEDSIPWTLVPPRKPNVIIEIFKSYASNYAVQGISLTDTTVVNEAKRLKKKYTTSLGYVVHIWTKDTNLKALEPDPENHPFIG